MKITILLALLAGVNLANAKTTKAPVQTDPCAVAAEEATERVETADAEKQNKEDKNAGASFDGINESSVDETDPSLYHVSYRFNEECLAGTVVKTHLSADGKTCTAADADVEQDGQPDCG